MVPRKKLSAKALAAFAKMGRRGGKIGGKALTIKPSEEERQVMARRLAQKRKQADAKT
jgi:hypothetical protein